MSQYNAFPRHRCILWFCQTPEIMIFTHLLQQMLPIAATMLLISVARNINLNRFFQQRYPMILIYPK
jgi:hypothetical protein